MECRAKRKGNPPSGTAKKPLWTKRGAWSRQDPEGCGEAVYSTGNLAVQRSLEEIFDSFTLVVTQELRCQDYQGYADGPAPEDG